MRLQFQNFDVTLLKSTYRNDFFAPFVKHCPVQMAVQFVEEYNIKSNNTILVIGKIIGLYIHDMLIEKDGFVNLSKGKVTAINGLDGYAIPQDLDSFLAIKDRKNNI